MNKYLKWFTRVVWVGIIFNLAVAVPSILTPQLLNITFGLGPEYSDVWLRNVGMLLLSMCLFYGVAAHAPLRFPAYSWLVAASRLIAAVFWLYMMRVTSYPGVMFQFFLADCAFGVALAVLLQLGMPPESRISLANLKRCASDFAAFLKAKWRLKSVRVGLAVLLVVGAAVGYVLWDNLLRARPDIAYASPEEHWKYGAIGLSNESRVPLYVWKALPRMFPEKLPGPGGYASFGLIVEEGK